MFKALVVSRYFPPVGSVGGSIRLVKWMKYLAKEGCSFTVLTQDPNRPITTEKESSEVLQGDFPEQLKIWFIRAPWNVSDSLPDKSIWKNVASILWGWGVFWQGLNCLKKEQSDLIFANMPHFINGLIAAILSYCSQVPLVLDMKDDIVGSSLYYSKSSFRQWIERAAESFIFKKAAKVTFATVHSLKVYQARYPNKIGDFHFLPNGCDLEEFSQSSSFQGDVPPNTFLILNAATRYRKDYRDAEPILRAISIFLEKNPKAREAIKVVFLGNSLGEEYLKKLGDYSLDGLVQNVHSKDRADYRAWLRRANLLFMVQPTGNTTSIAGTLYEYWATGEAPILLFASQGASWDLVTDYHIGRCFDFHDISTAAAYIEYLYQTFINGEMIRISNAGIDAFDRKKLALRMFELWQASVERPDTGTR